MNSNSRNLHLTVPSRSSYPALRVDPYASSAVHNNLDNSLDYHERVDFRYSQTTASEVPPQVVPPPEESWVDDYPIDPTYALGGSDIVQEEEEQEMENMEQVEETTSGETAVPEKKSMAELVKNFENEVEPDTTDLENYQRWLECESYYESARKLNDVMNKTRSRDDLGSMPMVQAQVVKWFPILESEFAKMQQKYLTKTRGEMERSETCFGPYLCALSPSKLAVITAKEALVMCLREKYNGVTFAKLTKRLGAAMEEEVLVEKLLHQQMLEKKQRKKDLGFDADGDDDEENIHTDDNDQPQSTDTNQAKTINAHRAYARSNLENFLKDMIKYDPGVNHKNEAALRNALRKTRLLLEESDSWPDKRKIQVGTALLHVLLENTTVKVEGKDEPAFKHELRWVKQLKKQGYVSVNEAFANLVTKDDLEWISWESVRYKPMVVPPARWTSASEGGYLLLETELMRFHGCKMQRELLDNSDLSTLLDGLNVLGAVPWKINSKILEVARRCWDDNISLGDIPTQTNFDLPEKPTRPEIDGFVERDSPEFKAHAENLRRYTEELAKYRRFQQKNRDLHSLRCSAILKLDQAEKFEKFDKIFFPYNVDFRGRAYPVPPHLSNVGSDLCRGMLAFASAKPLGKKGLYWLKVHLANLGGKDKVTFDERAAFTEENIAKVRESAEDPFGGERWWMGLDDPFQGLATCTEIINAIDSGDPESYMCSLPVHMDGSCNGLQHYAALGRDVVGGKAVNLCATDKPQDVYIGVMHEVIKRVSEEAQRSLDFDVNDPSKLSKDQQKELNKNNAAKLVNGKIDRGVVKRTVMTSVYGVTYIGARTQIQEKIEEKLEEEGKDIDAMDKEIFQACGYLAKTTMEVMGDLFQGARGTMNWLTSCARLLSEHGYPVAWISPIGLPAFQPYRREKDSTVVTLRQTVALRETPDDNPIHRQRQVTAFPPNFVHSLDSSHMLLVSATIMYWNHLDHKIKLSLTRLCPDCA